MGKAHGLWAGQLGLGRRAAAQRGREKGGGAVGRGGGGARGEGGRNFFFFFCWKLGCYKPTPLNMNLVPEIPTGLQTRTETPSARRLHAPRLLLLQNDGSTARDST